jgi:Uma2 family endonuclease
MARTAPRVTEPRPYRFSVEEFLKMGELGVFEEDARLELTEGEVIEMPPIGPGHATVVDRLNELFVVTYRDAALVRTQNPSIVGPRSLPRPDLALVRRLDYSTRHPTPEDVLLLVEVSDTTLRYDRERKVPLYARHGIAEVWLVDLAGQIVTAYGDPGDKGYRSARTYRRGDRLSPLAFPDRPLAVDDVLG